jgi:hypothetical protein
MRHLRTAVGLVAAICLLAVAAAPALAHEFKASKYKVTPSEATPLKVKAKSLEETKQVITLGPRVFKCLKATGSGILTEEFTKAVTTHVVFGQCGFYSVPNPKNEEKIGASIKGGLTVVWKVDGAAEFEGNGEGEELEYGLKFELLETATTVKIGASKLCTFIIPAQTIPAKAKVKPEEEFSVVSFSNEGFPVEETATNAKLYPGFIKHKVLFTYNVKPIKYKFAEETQCFEHAEEEGKKTEGTGRWEGQLLTEVVGGNIEFL